MVEKERLVNCISNVQREGNDENHSDGNFNSYTACPTFESFQVCLSRGKLSSWDTFYISTLSIRFKTTSATQLAFKF